MEGIFIRIFLWYGDSEIHMSEESEQSEPDATKYEEGDRIEQPYIGLKGTVVETHGSDSVTIEWDERPPLDKEIHLYHCMKI